MKFNGGKEFLQTSCILLLLICSAMGFSSQKMPVLARHGTLKGEMKRIADEHQRGISSVVSTSKTIVPRMKMSAAVMADAAAVMSSDILSKTSLMSRFSALRISKMIHVSMYTSSILDSMILSLSYILFIYVESMVCVDSSVPLQQFWDLLRENQIRINVILTSSYNVFYPSSLQYKSTAIKSCSLLNGIEVVGAFSSTLVTS